MGSQAAFVNAFSKEALAFTFQINLLPRRKELSTFVNHLNSDLKVKTRLVRPISIKKFSRLKSN